ncbi:MAG: L-2-amino-thiazoline-4-carboxylic acid hydrolase [Erysipelotrichaceae bacterium]|nr:L-2-amino-thiazoline-4-carboxylic acid hydrolase [Erysipelotrichaceae bacterium]
MKKNIKTKIYRYLYCSSFINGMKLHNSNLVTMKELRDEYDAIINRAKSVGNSNMLSSYCMGAFFIALYHLNNDVEQNYEIFKDGLKSNKIFKKALGSADSYLSEKKLVKRKKWEKESHLKIHENDWVVNVLANGENYTLGYDYLECGICKLCKDEGCFEIAKYLCKLDFILANIMGMDLKRTNTIADGAEYCDFRYSKRY